jgi:hypothetical protein
MLLSGALFALFMTGFWLYCLTDAILTPASECRGMPKRAWITIIILTFIGGAIAWLIVRPPVRDSSAPLAAATRWDLDRPNDSDAGYLPTQRWADADDAVARHPAGRARAADPAQVAPKGPDDDLEFLRALDRVIRGNS